MKIGYEAFIVSFIVYTILWFVSDGTLYTLVFGSTVMVIFFIYDATTAISSFGKDSQNLLQELIEINNKLICIHSAVEALKPRSSNSYEFYDEEE